MATAAAGTSIAVRGRGSAATAMGRAATTSAATRFRTRRWRRVPGLAPLWRRRITRLVVHIRSPRGRRRRIATIGAASAAVRIRARGHDWPMQFQRRLAAAGTVHLIGPVIAVCRQIAGPGSAIIVNAIIVNAIVVRVISVRVISVLRKLLPAVVPAVWGRWRTVVRAWNAALIV